MYRKTVFALGASLAGLAAAGAAQANVVTLNFEGIAPYPDSSNVQIGDFYNGGTSSIGTSGTNFGVHFGDNALLICLNSLTVTCSNTSRGGLAPASSQGALFFLTGGSTTLDYAAGFTDGFSFNYTSLSGSGGSVKVFSGLGGTGTLLGSFNLPDTASTCVGYSADFCPFFPIGIAFGGTALSVEFGGVANEVVFDDITFGSPTPGGAPEPATWALLLVGLGGTGGMLRAARRRAAAEAA